MKKMNAMHVAVLALVLAVAAIVMCVICCCPSKKAPQAGMSTADVEAALMAKPDMIMAALQKFEMQQREEAQMQANKVIQDNLDAINNDPNSPVLGNPNGKIVLVEFFDYSCGYCHRLYPAIQNILAKNSDVKFVAKEVAFVGEFSEYAARAVLAANEQGKYKEMQAALMNYQGGRLSEVIIKEMAQKVGLDMAKFEQDMNSDKVGAILSSNMELASKLQINGVPTMVLNGKVLQTISEAEIQEAIDALK